MKLKLTFVIALLGLVACTLQSNGEELVYDKSNPIENFLVGTKWHISQRLLGLDWNSHSYILKRVNANGSDLLENVVLFKDSVNYISYNTPSPDDDCLVIVYGKYKLSAVNYIDILVDSVSYRSDCSVSPQFDEFGLSFKLNYVDDIISLDEVTLSM